MKSKHPKRSPFLFATIGRAAAWLAAAVPIGLAVREVFDLGWGSGVFLLRFSPNWAVAFSGAVLAALAGLAWIGLGLWRPEMLKKPLAVLIGLRERLGWLRWPLILVLLAVPAWAYHFADLGVNWTALLGTFYLRQIAFLLLSALIGMLAARDARRLLPPLAPVFGLALFGYFMYSAGYFTEVVDYPFSLGWSEGNRLYDYSLIFGQDLYNHAGPVANPYSSPLRYVLWGFPFLIKGLPIAAHRFWDAFLYTAPVLLAAWLLVRPVRPALLRWTLALALVLFLNQGPVYPHLFVPAVVMLLFLYHPNIYVRGGSLAAASVLLGLSRWTWAVGPGIWGALVDLFLFYPQRRGHLIKRLAPTAWLALAGVLPGVLPSWILLFTSSGSGSIATGQPFLWYRLFPNPTFATGILPAALLAGAPAVIFLAWLALTRRWRMDWVQAAAAFGSLAALLAVGIVISLKIGGGGNLHNLDLYLVTLALIVGLYFVRAGSSGRAGAAYPAWVKAVIALAILVPYYGAVSPSSGPVVPAQADTQITLQAINDQVTASPGEVLFIDQRQLLTFGFVPAIPFIPEYEKKYMMDQAMAGNREYFLAYYRDLSDRRFSIIVTEPMQPVYEDPSLDDYAEENNAWTFWVAEPTLCFYEPLYTFKKVWVELLVPRAETSNCAGYTQGLP